jgi:hypothetical protein
MSRLKKGPRANVVIGPEGNHYIALEGASVNLLAHFSPTARNLLLESRGTVLIIPDGDKKAVLWIYKYLQAGEQDPTGLDAFDALTSDTLIHIHTHCAFLEYQPLMQRTEGRLKGKFYGALPSVEEIKAYQKSIPALYKFAIRCLANEMVMPWTCNYTTYYALAATNKAFAEDMGKAVRELLDVRVKRSEQYYQNTKDRRVLWAMKYTDSVLAGVPTPIFKNFATKPTKSAKQMEGEAPSLFHKTKASPNSSATMPPAGEGIQGTASGSLQQQSLKAKKSFSCYKWGGEGHIARNCQAEIEDITESVKKTEGPLPECYGCGETGHIRRNCPSEQSGKIDGGEGLQTPANPFPKSKAREPFLCYNCGEEGQMFRDCTVEVPGETVEFVDTSTTAREYGGRNKHFRRAQRDHEIGPKIYTYEFGGGITTCDREVKQGERTRLGLTV